MKLTINEIVTSFRISNSSAFLWFTYHEDVKILLKYAYFVKKAKITKDKIHWLKTNFKEEKNEIETNFEEQKRHELETKIKPFIENKMPNAAKYLNCAIELYLLNLKDKQMIGYYNLFFS